MPSILAQQVVVPEFLPSAQSGQRLVSVLFSSPGFLLLFQRTRQLRLVRGASAIFCLRRRVFLSSFVHGGAVEQIFNDTGIEYVERNFPGPPLQSDRSRSGARQAPSSTQRFRSEAVIVRISSISRGMIGRLAMSVSAVETAVEIARNAVLEVSGMIRVSALACMSNDFLIADGSRERISCRIPLTRIADPSVTVTGSGHSLISSGSSLSFFFVFVVGISEQMRLEGSSVNGTRAQFLRFASEEQPQCLCRTNLSYRRYYPRQSIRRHAIPTASAAKSRPPIPNRKRVPLRGPALRHIARPRTLCAGTSVFSRRNGDERRLAGRPAAET
ncbi:hypothetical protein PMI11_01645 [Rhizobium sp. CF142]|nr:hypothetical protein PMI11_01645 [Rhizobium sp. CF142]